jgi:hypothetical protein
MTSERFYPITSVCKDDFRYVFLDGNGKLPVPIARQIDKLTDADMGYIASKLADAFFECCYWEALEAIFLDYWPVDAEPEGSPVEPSSPVEQTRGEVLP